MKINQRILDKCGIILSLGCVLHCVLLPIILPLLPLLGFVVGHESHFHLFLGAIIALTAVMALIPGYLKHRKKWPLLYGTIGVASIMCGGIMEMYPEIFRYLSVVITVIGSVNMVSAHYLNHKFNSCLCSHHKHK